MTRNASARWGVVRASCGVRDGQMGDRFEGARASCGVRDGEMDGRSTGARASCGVRGLLAFGSLGLLLVACTGERGTFSSTTPPPATTAPATVGTGTSQRPVLEALATQCRNGGAAVHVGGVPATGVDHSGLVEAFQATYPGVDVKADESGNLDADVVEVGPSEALSLSNAHQVAAFTPSVVGEVPGLTQGQLAWAYSAMVVFAVDRTRVAQVPSSFQELNNNAYAGQVHLVGNPSIDVNALAVVMAASMALGGDASDTARGTKYFLSAGNAGVTTTNADAPIVVGTTVSVAATVEKWQNAGREVRMVFPVDGLAGVPVSPLVVQGSNRQACAQLWVEHLLGDDGALAVLLAHGVPARLASLQQRGLLTSDMVAMVPSVEQWATTVQFTGPQLAAALGPVEASTVWK